MMLPLFGLLFVISLLATGFYLVDQFEKRGAERSIHPKVPEVAPVRPPVSTANQSQQKTQLRQLAHVWTEPKEEYARGIAWMRLALDTPFRFEFASRTSEASNGDADRKPSAFVGSHIASDYTSYDKGLHRRRRKLPRPARKGVT